MKKNEINAVALYKLIQASESRALKDAARNLESVAKLLEEGRKLSDKDKPAYQAYQAYPTHLETLTTILKKFDKNAENLSRADYTAILEIRVALATLESALSEVSAVQTSAVEAKVQTESGRGRKGTATLASIPSSAPIQAQTNTAWRRADNNTSKTNQKSQVQMGTAAKTEDQKAFEQSVAKVRKLNAQVAASKTKTANSQEKISPPPAWQKAVRSAANPENITPIQMTKREPQAASIASDSIPPIAAQMLSERDELARLNSTMGQLKQVQQEQGLKKEQALKVIDQYKDTKPQMVIAIKNPEANQQILEDAQRYAQKDGWSQHSKKDNVLLAVVEDTAFRIKFDDQKGATVSVVCKGDQKSEQKAFERLESMVPYVTGSNYNVEVKRDTTSTKDFAEKVTKNTAGPKF